MAHRAFDFKRTVGKIWYAEFIPPNLFGELGCTFLGGGKKRWIISLNQNNDLQRNVETFVHELLHIGIEGENMSPFEPPSNSLENRIETETQYIIQNRPVLVEHFRKVLQNRKYMRNSSL